MITLDELERRLEVAIKEARPAAAVGVDKTVSLAATLAAEYIGHEMPEWPPLAATTIADKQSKGFPVPHPLERTGAMRDSIGHEIDVAALEGVAGAKDKVAVFQEMGTERGIPPRPFLALGMKNSLPFAGDIFGEIAVKLLTGRK